MIFGCAAVVNVPVKKLAVAKLPKSALPNDPLPVADTIPVVIKLPPVILAVALNVPVMFAPVPVIVMVVLPAEAIVTFPLAVAIFTLLLPFDTPAVFNPVN